MSLKSSKSVVNSAIKKILPVRLKSNGTLFFFDRQFATLLPDLVLIERYIFNSFFILCSLIVCSVSLREVYFSSIVCSVSEQGSAPAGARPLGTPPNQLSPTAPASWGVPSPASFKYALRNISYMHSFKISKISSRDNLLQQPPVRTVDSAIAL